MEMYETEEQQIEAAKKWWKENGTSLIVGAVLGLSLVGGWKFYQGEQHAHQVLASDYYETLVANIAEQKSDETIEGLTEVLANEFDDTPYAALAALLLAKNDYERGDVKSAISRLKWASTNAIDVETREIAKTRLIRLYISDGKLDEADKLLSEPSAEAFNMIYDELKGDLFVAKGDVEAARIAYDSAINASESGPGRALKLKRDALGL